MFLDPYSTTPKKFIKSELIWIHHLRNFSPIVAGRRNGFVLLLCHSNQDCRDIWLLVWADIDLLCYVRFLAAKIILETSLSKENGVRRCRLLLPLVNCRITLLTQEGGIFMFFSDLMLWFTLRVIYTVASINFKQLQWFFCI